MVSIIGRTRPPPENTPMGGFLFLFVLAAQTCNSALGGFTGIAGTSKLKWSEHEHNTMNIITNNEIHYGNNGT